MTYEWLAPLLLWLRDQLHASLVVVEHVLRLITAIADRVLTMADGRVVAEECTPRATSQPQVRPQGSPLQHGW